MTTGTIGIADGGVGAAQIAFGAVGSDQIADGSIGSPDIDATQVQARVFGTCDPGFYVRGINQDGSVLCSPLVNQNRLFSTFNPFSSGGGVGNLPSIAIGSDGNPIISHKNYANGPLALLVEHCSNPVCSGNITQTIIDSADNVGSHSSLAIGNDGLPIISYEDFTAGALKVAKCNDIACATPPTITVVDDPTNEVGEWTSIAVPADGLPVIGYHDKTAGTLKVAKCANADCTGSATITVVDDDPTNDVGQSLSLAIGSDGLPVIAYHDVEGGALKIAKCVDPACSDPVVPTTIDASPGAFNFGAFPSIDVGDDGFPVISYQASAVLRVAKCVSTDCTGTPILSTLDQRPASNIGAWTSLEIGLDGRPNISYSANVGGVRDPAFIRCATVDCSGPGNQIVTFSTSDLADGQQTSLAIRPDGAPVFVHWEQQAGTLGIVVCGTLGCQ